MDCIVCPRLYGTFQRRSRRLTFRPALQQKVAMRTIQDVIERVRAEYLEMPGLRLRAEQVQRLCGIERSMCQTALDALVNAKFLAVNPDGHYARSTAGYHPLPAKADLRTQKRSGKAS